MPVAVLDEDFFLEQTEASRIKSKIVSKYLDAWGLVLSTWAPKLVYADFFAGCGKYEDGSPSTPLEVISKIAARDSYKNKINCIFNELNSGFHQQLCININAHLDTSKLLYSPLIQNQSFEELPVLEQLRSWLKLKPNDNLPPSLVFVDPWGYRGLSLNHFADVLKLQGCEVIFFFNYNRINGALNNPFMVKHMSLLFGNERAESLKHELALIKNQPQVREAIILKAVKDKLQQEVAPRKCYVQDFRFMKGNRVSHYVIFATAHPKGFGLMKEIMATESASYPDGMPSYQYSSTKLNQLELFGGMSSLGEELLKFYSNKTISVDDIYTKHQVLGPYIRKNYKDTLLWLEERGLITASKPRSARMRLGKPTMGDAVMITFS
jgi:three-Cys-motif partner protein